MAGESAKKILKYYIQKLKSFFFSKDILSFLIFLALSAAFWFVHALGKERETIVSLPVRYTGVPRDILITNSPPSEIKLSIRDQGIHLMAYSTGKALPLTIDLGRSFNKRGEIVITPDKLNEKVAQYMRFKPSTTVLEIKPDSILIQYEKLSVRTLPIELVSKIELAHQYILSNKIQLEPSHINVYGPKRILDRLKSVRTELVEITSLADTNVFTCKIKKIKSVRFSVNTVKVGLFVEPFTEKKVQLPITIINCPENLILRVFPAFVGVTYNVGLSHFNSVPADALQVQLDYNEINDDILDKQKLKIVNNTDYISDIRITPQEVEFLVEPK